MMALAFCAASVGGLQRFLRALVAPVGQKDKDFPAALGAELVVGGEIDGVEEQRAAGVRGGQRAAADAGNACRGAGRVDRGVVDGAFDFTGIVGVVRQQIDVHVEGDEEGLVLGREDVLEERGSGLLLERKNVLLRSAGIELGCRW